MTSTHPYPEVLTASVPDLDLQGEIKYEDYNLSNIIHVVAHLSDTRISDIIESATGAVYDSNDTPEYLDFIGKMLSKAIFGKENLLEWLGTECHGRRQFVAFTNIKKKEKCAQRQSSADGRLQVIEIMFLWSRPQEKRKIFWRPAREIVCRRVQARASIAVEMVRVRIRPRFDKVRRRKGSTSA
ncbi:hypothetical protein N7475_005430 [Penicillium sp. IBT 31633x]|nr:hypothetical protein N7475_005430 [Penicillium sp. IBT 31633x]